MTMSCPGTVAASDMPLVLGCTAQPGWVLHAASSPPTGRPRFRDTCRLDTPVRLWLRSAPGSAGEQGTRSCPGEDGWLSTAPVRSDEPNGYGLWQPVGNVWEWCSDWHDRRYYSVSTRHDPVGPTTGTVKALRGGSYLCHDSYCNRYRNAARSSNTPDSSMGNAGFRTVSVP